MSEAPPAPVGKQEILEFPEEASLKHGIQNLDSGIWNPESAIHKSKKSSSLNEQELSCMTFLYKN